MSQMSIFYNMLKDKGTSVIEEVREKPNPKPISISGIYTICLTLGLPKGGRPVPAWPIDAPLAVRMLSNQIAIYHYKGCCYATNVDWVWHSFVFHRYALANEKLDMPFYN